jgi:hypothetical protein
LKAVGAIDPLSLQIIVRQMVQDMLQTELHPMLHEHADIQGTLAGRMMPQGGNGTAANGTPAPPPMAPGGPLSAPAGMVGTMPPPGAPPGPMQ